MSKLYHNLQKQFLKIKNIWISLIIILHLSCDFTFLYQIQYIGKIDNKMFLGDESMVWMAIQFVVFMQVMCPDVNGVIVNVRDLGAVGNANVMDTQAIQKGIDMASEKQCTLIIPSGLYLSGSLHLKSNVHIYLEPGAVILGSQKKEDYDPYEKLDFPNDSDKETSFFHHSLMWGEDIENVSITGSGTIDSNFMKRGGPKALAFKRCKNINIEGITIRNVPNYTISLLGCEKVIIDKVQILNAYADGIDPDSCRFVFISNCRIESVDDAIVPKSSFSLGYRFPCTDITITNCYLSTCCNGFKLGTESGSDFKRITVNNCIVKGFVSKNENYYAVSGISLESVDGSNIEGIAISDVIIDKARTPIFIRLGNRGRDKAPGPGSIQGVTISNIVATNVSNPNIIAGLPDHPVENILIQNVSCVFSGSNPLRPISETIPEEEARYPEALMFESLPCYALFIRHAKGVQLQNISFTAKSPFWRLTTYIYKNIKWDEQGNPTNYFENSTPSNAVYIEDTDGLILSDWRENCYTNEAPLLYLKDVQNAQIETPLHNRTVPQWCTIAGENSKSVYFKGPALTTLNKHIELKKEVKKTSIYLEK